MMMLIGERSASDENCIRRFVSKRRKSYNTIKCIIVRISRKAEQLSAAPRFINQATQKEINKVK